MPMATDRATYSGRGGGHSAHTQESGHRKKESRARDQGMEERGKLHVLADLDEECVRSFLKRKIDNLNIGVKLSDFSMNGTELAVLKGFVVSATSVSFLCLRILLMKPYVVLTV